MTNRTRPSTAMVPFSKATVLKQLRDSESAIERTIKSHEDAIAEWRETALAKLAQMIKEYDPNLDSYGSRQWDFSPPRLNQLCSDYRVQAINKAILRVEAMAQDENGTIKLRNDDQLWDYVNYASCL